MVDLSKKKKFPSKKFIIKYKFTVMKHNVM